MKNYIAVAKAEAVAARYGRNPFAIARRLGYRLAYEPLPPGVEEMIVPDARLLFLTPECQQQPDRARQLTAHALGHHFLHEGSQVCDPVLPRDFFVHHEQQAQAFSATLLFGRRAGEVV